MDGVSEPLPRVADRPQRTQIVLDRGDAARLIGHQKKKRLDRIIKNGLPVSVRYQRNARGAQSRILLVPLHGFTHLSTGRRHRKYYQKNKFYDVTISFPTEWPRLWYRRRQGAFIQAWARERNITLFTRPGVTRLRNHTVAWHPCVASTLTDGQLRLPLDLIGPQRVSVGGHCHISTVSL